MQRNEVSVYIGLGANLGNAQATVLKASTDLGSLPLTQWQACSPLYRSSPVDAQGPDFVNAVVHVRTRLNAIDLLHACQQLENKAGRERPYHNAPRTLDIDVLLYGDANVHCAELIVPHPRMMERAFVLVPLRDIAPQWVSMEALDHVCAQVVQPIVSTLN